jgi:hypothetical protein
MPTWCSFQRFVLTTLLGVAVSSAQEFSSIPLGDPYVRGVQAKYGPQLRELASEVGKRSFPFRFTLGSVIPKDPQLPDQHGQAPVRFSKYNSALTLQISGNYSVSYTASKLSANDRVRRTFLEVILPILTDATSKFRNSEMPLTYMVEVSHHIQSRVLGIPTEGIETVAILIPQLQAERLVHARTPEDQEQALLDGTVYVNAEPMLLWLTEDEPPKEERQRILEHSLMRQKEPDNTATYIETRSSLDHPLVSERLLGTIKPLRPRIDPPSLDELNTRNRDLLDKVSRELEPQMHFVPYAPPTFIEFHGKRYLQLTITTVLDSSERGSRYKIAALAFDEHIVHFIRPTLALLPETGQWDGIVFSSMVKTAGSDSSEAVEFFFPTEALHYYKTYDLNGQQLIDRGLVLLDGEPAHIDLLRAEATTDSAAH